MRHIPSALQARLDSGATTLCRCWIVTRKDDVTQGFTDHDQDLVIGDTTCHADTGFDGSEASARLGLAVDGAEISGALSDEALNESALAAGKYDGAQVDTYLVDWREPDLRVLLSRGHIGEVRREGNAFVAELRSLADALAQETGRLYTAGCTADLGDARCGVDLDDPAFRGEGAVVELTAGSTFIASGLEDFEDGVFTAGRLTFVTGANAGSAMEVKQHRRDRAVVTLSLWQAMAEPIAAGDAFAVTAGCDKRFATCRDRFENAANFRGFPHIPGIDFVIRYANDGEPGNDGASMQQA